MYNLSYKSFTSIKGCVRLWWIGIWTERSVIFTTYKYIYTSALASLRKKFKSHKIILARAYLAM